MPSQTYTIDASGKILGRLATEVVNLLRGKNNPKFQLYIDSGNSVTVFNTDKIEVTGNKTENKIYYRHSKYIGGFREEKYKDLFKRDSGEVFKKAVSGMLPKNRLRAKMMKRLKLYPGEVKK